MGAVSRALAVGGAASWALLAGCGDPKTDLVGTWSGTGYEAASDAEHEIRLALKDRKYRNSDSARLTLDGETAGAYRFNVSDEERVRARFRFQSGAHVRLKATVHDDGDELRGWLRIEEGTQVRRVQFRLKGRGDVSHAYVAVKTPVPVLPAEETTPVPGQEVPPGPAASWSEATGAPEEVAVEVVEVIADPAAGDPGGATSADVAEAEGGRP